MTNFELSNPGAADHIDKDVIGAACSMIPGSLSAVDRTMEETFMKFAKSSGMSECILMTTGFFHLILPIMMVLSFS